MRSVMTLCFSRELLLGFRCRGDTGCDASAGAPHSSTRAVWQTRRGRGRDGRHGGGHPGHGGTPVRDVRRAALRPHSSLPPRSLRLPHLVGRRLPSDQLSVWRLLPPVPDAELRKLERRIHASHF